MSVQRTVTICNERGLHARASAKFVKLATTFDAKVVVCRDDQCVEAESIMGLMMLAAGPGSTVELKADGPQAEEAVEALCALVSCRFEEER